MTAAIRLDGVSRRFPNGHRAVDRLTLEVHEREILAIIGPSGSGKSTTLRLIAGFERPDEGSLEVRSRVVADAHAFVPPERRGVGMVFQDYALFPHLSVADNVAFGLHRLPAAARPPRVEALLDLVGLGGLGPRYPHQLSGGQQQRVALARALAPAPDVLLLDEPLSNLDADLRVQTRHEVQRILRATAVTTVLVTHDQQEALILADRVAVLAQGRLQQIGSPVDVYEHPATRFVADFVGEADFLAATVVDGGFYTEIGHLPWAGPLPAHGTPVDLMLRPDDVTLEAAPGTTADAFITAREYRGPEIAYAVALPSGATLHAHRLRGAASLHLGARVRLRVEPGRVVPFGGDGARLPTPGSPSPAAKP